MPNEKNQRPFRVDVTYREDGAQVATIVYDDDKTELKNTRKKAGESKESIK